MIKGYTRRQARVIAYFSCHPNFVKGIKGLHEKLDVTRRALAPRTKFAFKSTLRKNNSAISLSDAAELALQQRATLFRSPQDVSPKDSPYVPTPNKIASPPIKSVNDLPILSGDGSISREQDEEDQMKSQIRKMSFTASSSVEITSHNGIHIILPSAAAHATSSGSLTNLQRCIVDMSMPTGTGCNFATLTIKNVLQSLLICGNVSGAAYVTGVHESIIVVAARQFRMHECSNCTVYLHASSKPIIEDCHGIRFAPLPAPYVCCDPNPCSYAS